MKRAYAQLEIRATGTRDGKRTFSGIATTPTPDSYGDIIESDGAEFKLPMPLLWQHDSRDPIGHVTAARVTKRGIEVDGEVADIADDGTDGAKQLRTRIDLAWQYMKNKLVRGLSIGFNPIEFSQMRDTGGYRFTKWMWLELSAVTIAANADASITAIRSADTQLRALSGLERPGAGSVARSPAPSSTARPAVAGTGSKRTDMKTVAQLREERANKVARMTEMRDLRTSENRKFSVEEAGEFDTLTTEVDELEDDIRMGDFDDRMKRSARPVQKSHDADDDERPRRGPTVFSRKADPDPKFEGEAFVRLQIAKAIALKKGESPMWIAEQRWGKTHKQLVQVMRATVAGHGSGSGEAGAELLALDAMYTGDFITFLYKKTLFDTLPLRPVPANVRVKGQDGQFTGYWVGESKAIGMSKGDYSSIDLTPLKVAGLTVISMELLEDSSPAAEGLVRDGLVNASSQRVDSTFFSATAASAGVSPAGLLNGLSGIASSGTDLAATRADLSALLGPFVAAQMASGIVLVMNPAQGLALSMMYGALDQPAYPDVNENGGTINRRQVYTGDNVTSRQVLALRPEDIWKIGDSGIRIEMSTQATIEQRDTDVTGATDTPTGVTTTGLTSMFQEESVAFKVVRRINFQKRRTGAVQYLTGVEWGGVLS